MAFVSGRDIRISVGEETNLDTERQAADRRRNCLELLGEIDFGASTRITDLATIMAHTIDDDGGGEARINSMKDTCKPWPQYFTDGDMSDELKPWEVSVRIDADNYVTAQFEFGAGYIIGFGRVSLSLCPLVGGDLQHEVKFPGCSPMLQFTLQCDPTLMKSEAFDAWLTQSDDRAREALDDNGNATQTDYANVAFEPSEAVGYEGDKETQRPVQIVVLKALGPISKNDVLRLAMCQNCKYFKCQCGVGVPAWKKIKSWLPQDRDSALLLIGQHIDAYTPGPETHPRVLLRSLREVGDLARRGIAIVNAIKNKGGFTTIHSILYPVIVVMDVGMHSIYDARILKNDYWKAMLTKQTSAKFVKDYSKGDDNEKATAEQTLLNATLPQVAAFLDDVLEVVATNLFRLPKGCDAGEKLRDYALQDAAFVITAPGSLGQHEHLDHEEFLDNKRIGTYVVVFALTAGQSTVFIKPPQNLNQTESRTPLSDNKAHAHWKKWEHYDFPCVPGDIYAFPGGKAVHNGPKNESREQRAVVILVFGDEYSDGTPIMEDDDHWPGVPEEPLPKVVSARRAHN